MYYFLFFVVIIFLRVIKIMEGTNETAFKISQFISALLWLAVIVLIIYAFSVP